jgi:hypothetical protein
MATEVSVSVDKPNYQVSRHRPGDSNLIPVLTMPFSCRNFEKMPKNSSKTLLSVVYVQAIKVFTSTAFYFSK